MKSAIVIPARLESSRLERKLLLSETGKTLIEHTWRAASSSNLANEIIVATDSSEIFETVRAFGGNAVMTSAKHQNGSARVAEAAQDLDVDVIVNLQGDEPEVSGETIDKLIQRLVEQTNIEVATLATPIRSRGQLMDPACVKVVLDLKSQALYFSRSPIPASKDPSDSESYFQNIVDGEFPPANPLFYQHLGIYGFRKESLIQLPNLAPSPLEQSESLEQLRFLANGWKIGVEIVSQAGAGIDTADDYAAFVNRVQNS